MAAAQDASTAHATRKQRLVSESNKYETVEELLYVNRQKRFLTEEQAQLQMCACKTREADKDGPICTSAQCENVASRTECPMGTCSKKRCQNKRFQRREWAKMEVFETEDKGNGVRTLQDIATGDFIMEYVGEVISQEVYKERMAKYHAEGRTHFYMMSLGGGEYIDAALRGNYGRFLNHCCTPNVATNVWQVGAEERVGVFATSDIAAGDELTLDYQWQRVGITRVVCHCGADNCRAYLGATDEQLQATAAPPAGSWRAPTAPERTAGHGLDMCFIKVCLPAASAQAAASTRFLPLPSATSAHGDGTWANEAAQAAAQWSDAQQTVPEGSDMQWFTGHVLVFDDVAKQHRVQLVHNNKWLTLHLEQSGDAQDNAWPWMLLDSPDAPVRVQSLAPLVSAEEASASGPGAGAPGGTALDSDEDGDDLFADADDDAGDDMDAPALEDTEDAHDSPSASEAGEEDDDVTLENMLGEGRAPLAAQDLAARALALSHKRREEAMKAQYAQQAAAAAADAARVAANAAQAQLQAQAATGAAAGTSALDAKLQVDMKMAEYLQQQAEAAEVAAEEARAAAAEAHAEKRAAAKKRRREEKDERQATAADRKLARASQKAAAQAARRSAVGAVRSASLTAVGSKRAPKFRPAPATLIPAPVPVEDVCGAQGGRLPDALPGDANLEDIVPAFGMAAPFALSWRFTATEVLGDTPSRRDGVSLGAEQQWRRSVGSLLLEAAVVDALPLNLALHAAVLLQRAVAVRSTRGMAHRPAVAAALALAGSASPWHKLSVEGAAWTTARGAVSGDVNRASTCAVYATDASSSQEARPALVVLKAGSTGLKLEAQDASLGVSSLLVACRWDTSVPDLSSIIAQCLGQAVALPALFGDLGVATQAGEQPSATVRVLAAATIAASAHGRVADWIMHALSAATAGSTLAEIAKGGIQQGAQSSYWGAMAGDSAAKQRFAAACSSLAYDAVWRSGLPQVAPLVLNVLSHAMVLSNLVTAPHDCLMHTLPAWVLGNVYCSVAHLQSMLSLECPEWLVPFSATGVRLEMTPAGGAMPPSMVFPGTYKRTAAVEAVAEAAACASVRTVPVVPPTKPDKAGSLAKGRDAQLGATVLVDALDVAWAAATVGQTLLQPGGVCDLASAPVAALCAEVSTAAVHSVLGSCLQQPPPEWGHDVQLPSPEGIAAHAASLLNTCAQGGDCSAVPDPLALSLAALQSRAGVATAADGSIKQFNMRAADPRGCMRTSREFQFLRSLGGGRFLARDLRFSHLPCLDTAIDGGITCRLVVLQAFEGEVQLQAASNEQLAAGDSASAEADTDAQAALNRKAPSVQGGKCVQSLQKWAAQVSSLRNTHGYLGEVGKSDVSGQAAHPMMVLDALGDQGPAKRGRGDGAGAASPAVVTIRGISCRDATAEGVQGIVGNGVGILSAVKRNAHVAAPVEVVLGINAAEAISSGGTLTAAGVHAPPADLETFFSTPMAEGGGRGLLVDGMPQSHLQRSSYVVFEHWAHNLSGLCMEGVLLSAGQQQRLGFQLLRGVLRMHQLAYAHGCISPDSVCFARDGMVKLLPRPSGQRSVRDFDVKQVAGILKEIGGSGTRTGQALLRKTADDADTSGRLPPSQLQCMAPELLMGAGFMLPSSDAWSVACVLAHALLGRPLFAGSTRQEVLRSIVAIAGPITKRWPACRYLPLHSLVSPAELQRSEAKKLGGAAPPQLEELLLQSGVSKAHARLLRKMLVLDPSQRPDAKAALHNEYFKAFVPPSKPAVQGLDVGGDLSSCVKQRIAGTVLLSSFDRQQVIAKTTFRASLPYGKAEAEALLPYNHGETAPDAALLPRVAGDFDLAADLGAADDGADVAVPVDIDPFPYLLPCVMLPEDLAQQSAAERTAAWSAGLPVVSAASTRAGVGGSGGAALSDFGAGFA